MEGKRGSSDEVTSNEGIFEIEIESVTKTSKRQEGKEDPKRLIIS